MLISKERATLRLAERRLSSRRLRDAPKPAFACHHSSPTATKP